MTQSAADPKIITALDYAEAKDALSVVDQLDPTLTNLKVGKELFTRSGPALLDQLHHLGFRVFLDLKFHDIPNTVAGAVQVAVDMGVWMMTVHASGGRSMLQAARQAAPRGGHSKLVAVTVLTSLDNADLAEIGVNREVTEQVRRLATLSKECELDGVVCSPLESSLLRAEFDTDFMLVTPGIRPATSAGSDQKRVMTPAAALQSGSDYLVIGRPITQSDNPAQALQKIHTSIDEASHENA